MKKNKKICQPRTVQEFETLVKELEQMYGQKLNIFAGKHHARYLPDHVPVHVISRVFQGRYMLTPNRKLRQLITGIIGRAQEKYSSIKLYAWAVLSNHFHAMLSGTALELSRFIAYVKREISFRWGKKQEVDWPGTMWDRYLATALTTRESQIQCLKYILSQSVKEGLVAHPEQWTGFHCAKSLLTGKLEKGQWFDGTGYSKAKDAQKRRKNPKPVNRRDYVRTYGVRYSQIPAWQSDTEEQYRGRIRELVDEIVVEGRLGRKGKPPLGMKKVLAIPRNRRSELPAQPWLERGKKLICWGNPYDPAVQQFMDDYWRFQVDFRKASDAFLAGELTAEFPVYAFRPSSRPVTAKGARQ